MATRTRIVTVPTPSYGAGDGISDADFETEIGKARARYAGDQKTLKYFESDRGRNYIRSTLRRSRVEGCRGHRCQRIWFAGLLRG